MKILAISGSLRKASYNRQLALAAQALLATSNPEIEFEILEWADVPLLDQDIEFPAPAPVTRVRQAVKSADGIWLFVPEYNHSYPGVFKNLIDWLSRPISDSEGQVLAGKPVALSGASPGIGGASRSQEFLIPLLSAVDMPIMNSPRLTLPDIGELTDEKGKLVLGSSEKYLKRQADAFIDFIG